MKEKLLSIVIPVYNAENYIENTVKSLLDQTYKNLEVILVNDGSKDRSLEICEQLSKEDGRITVISKENGGAASARNLGIKNAKGDYIGLQTVLLQAVSKRLLLICAIT